MNTGTLSHNISCCLAVTREWAFRQKR